MKSKGYILMPMVKNLGYVEHEGWKLTECPICKEECYERPMPEEAKELYKDYEYVCTSCGLHQK